MALDQIERLADLHDRCAVGDVLGRGAPMTPLAEAVAAQADELLHHRQDRIPDPLRLGFELAEIDFGHIAMPTDLLGSLFRDDAEPRLPARQRRLEIEILLHAVFVGKDLPHGRRRENVAEHRGIDQ